jgi:flagellar hook-length control protein FliK
MNVAALTLTLGAGPLGQAARTRALEPGSQLVARVLAAPEQGGEGAIALAGATVPARLPRGVQPGQTLHLEVVRIDPGQLTVRIRSQHEDAGAPAALARTAGRLAVTGDGDLMRAALALAGEQPLWLPDGGGASVAVDPDDGREGARGGPSGIAAFCLHSPTLGAIEVRLTMARGGVRAGVVTPAGDAAETARAALPELAERLGAATGLPAAVGVNERPADQPEPPPPSGRVDVQV